MSSDVSIENKLKTVFSDVFGIETEEIDSKSSPDSIENWDSLKHVVLVVALEQEFGIKVEPENAMEMISFELTLNTVKTLLNKKNNA